MRIVHFFEFLQLPVIICLKDHLDQGIFRPGPDKGLIRFASESQVYGTDYDRFARSGFSGQNIEAIRKGDLFLLNKSQILNM